MSDNYDVPALPSPEDIARAEAALAAWTPPNRPPDSRRGMMPVQTDYVADGDAIVLYAELGGKKTCDEVMQSIRVSDDIRVSLYEDGRLFCVEILNASRVVPTRMFPRSQELEPAWVIAPCNCGREGEKCRVHPEGPVAS